MIRNQVITVKVKSNFQTSHYNNFKFRLNTNFQTFMSDKKTININDWFTDVL